MVHIYQYQRRSWGSYFTLNIRNVSNTATVYMVQLPKCKFNVSSETKCILDTVIMTSTCVHCDHIYGLCESCWGTSCCLLGDTVSSVVSVNVMTGFHIFTHCWTWRDTRMMIHSRTSQVTSKCINPIISSLIQALMWSNAIAHPALTMEYMANGAIRSQTFLSVQTLLQCT
jgi:hypothetical protein